MKRKGKGKVVWILLVLLAAAVAALLLLPAQQAKKGDEGAISSNVDEEALKADLQAAVDDSAVTIRINGEMTLGVDGMFDLIFVNEPQNSYGMKVTITLDGGGAAVYESPVIAPGEKIERAAFAQLDEGTHSATALIELTEDEKTVGQTAVAVRMKV